MNLSTQDASLFFKLMWDLQFFVKGKLKLLPNITSVETYAKLTSEQKITVRDALYEQPKLIDEFVKTNPNQLTAEELGIVVGWKQAIVGEFYIERFLKQHTIFIGKEKVYGVLGLYDALDQMIPSSALPLYVKAVLLPFKGKIIYDGLFQPYRVFFGGGIRGDLRETYMAAKQNQRIITSLEELSQAGKASKAKTKVVQKPDLSSITAQVEKLRVAKDAPATWTPVIRLLKASVDLANQAVENPDAVSDLEKATRKVNQTVANIWKTLERMDR